MSKTLVFRILGAMLMAMCLTAPVLGQPSLKSSGFTENFDSMGVDGTWPPDGWTVYTIPGSASTWSAATGILAEQMSPEFFGRPSSGLTATLNPSSTNNNGYNAATSDAPDDRALVTAPTSVAGGVLELALT